MTTAAGGGYAAFTGTSFATPFVTGSAALLMEWGIVRGNDPYLYGEKVKAYLRRGAKELPGFLVFFNGAASGASAPDHFHFQAVPQRFVPLVAWGDGVQLDLGVQVCGADDV